MNNTETAFFGTGCFWCSEAIFSRLKGVSDVTPGFAGGTVPNPSYELVCTGKTGHAEVARITFDPQVIAYKDLLEVFWNVHDPTTLNRQGEDVGTQYRSIILYTTEEQRLAAEQSLKEQMAAHAFKNPIVTVIQPLEAFYPAEAYHKDYYAHHSNQPYCQLVISPKVNHFMERYAAKVKPE